MALLEKDYHVIAASADGYDGTGETMFTTATASAQKLERCIRDNLNGSTDLLFGEARSSPTQM